MTVQQFQRIPVEMRAYPHWVCWRYEDTDGPKPTKVPYGPLTGQLANVNDPNTWATFDAACAAFEHHKYSGIGFVLSEMDPYAFIDLDDANGDPVALQRQQLIAREFASYAERSPSGKGLHIIVKGSIPAGRRRSSIEIYSSQRYMTMTGDVWRESPINDCNDLLAILWREMGGDAAAQVYSGDEAERYPDSEVVARALKAVNGNKFDALLKGNWQQFYPSQSEADFAFVDIIAFYTQNREQIRRLFLNSPLGQRDKAKRPDYVSHMVTRSFDRMLPPVDIDGLRNQLEERLAAMRARTNQGFSAPLPAVTVAPRVDDVEIKTFDYTLPPGLVGELAQFIHAASPRPVPEIALVAALGLMAGICGRAFNVSGTGLNLYLLLLAPTGTGKEAMASGIDRILTEVRRTVPAITEFMGPAEIRSDAGLLRWIAKESKSFVSLVGEFGLMLKQISTQNASSHQTGIRRAMLDLFNKSGEGQMFRPIAYSDRERNTETLLAPSFSVLGESVPERFYEQLDETMISEGLLPRFMTVEYNGPRPSLNRNHITCRPSAQLVEAVAALAGNALMLNNSNTAVKVKLSPEAETLFNNFDAFCDTQINTGRTEVSRQLWNRAHIKALKLSALIAVGIHPYEPVIFPDVGSWAISLVCHDIRSMLSKFETGAVGQATGSGDSKQIQEMVEAIRVYISSDFSELKSYTSYPALHNDKVIPQAYLSRRLLTRSAFRLDRLGATNALKRTIQHLLDTGDLREISKHDCAIKYNTSARCFAIAHPKTFGL